MKIINKMLFSCKILVKQQYKVYLVFILLQFSIFFGLFMQIGNGYYEANNGLGSSDNYIKFITTEKKNVDNEELISIYNKYQDDTLGIDVLVNRDNKKYPVVLYSYFTKDDLKQKKHNIDAYLINGVDDDKVLLKYHPGIYIPTNSELEIFDKNYQVASGTANYISDKCDVSSKEELCLMLTLNNFNIASSSDVEYIKLNLKNEVSALKFQNIMNDINQSGYEIVEYQSSAINVQEYSSVIGETTYIVYAFALLSFIYIYKYILENRQSSVAIMQMCGLNKIMSLVIMIIEIIVCFTISLLATILLYSVLNNSFNTISYFKYDFKTLIDYGVLKILVNTLILQLVVLLVSNIPMIIKSQMLLYKEAKNYE